MTGPPHVERITASGDRPETLTSAGRAVKRMREGQGPLATLRARTLLIVAVTTLALAGGMYLPLRAVLLGSFVRLEEDLSRRHVERVLNAVRDEVEKLYITARDYACWDDSYRFLRGGGRDRAFIDVNFVDTTFVQNRLSLLLLSDTAGRVVYAKGFDRMTGVERPPPPPDGLRFPVDAPYAARGRGTHGEAAGLVSTPDGPMLVAAHPVLTSSRGGPPAGTLVMGRSLDADEVRRLAEALRLDVGVRTVAEAANEPELASALGRLSVSAPVHVQAIDDRLMTGYGLLADVRGDPFLLFRIGMPREVYARGLAGSRSLALSVAIAGLVFGAVVLLLVERLVVAPVTRLSDEVQNVADRADHSLRVTATGQGEIAHLGLSINGMLGSLERLTRLLNAERERSERLLLNVLPKSIADRLKQDEQTIADSFAEVTVLFSDLVGFTDLAARVGPVPLVTMLNGVFSRFDALAERHGLEKIKTIGDAYMVVAGLPEPHPDHVEAVAAMALDMLEAMAEFNRERGAALEIRIGINTGPVVAGVIGRKKFIYDLWGDSVNIASRMESSGLPGRIQVTEPVYLRLRDRFEFETRGPIQVKGKGEMRTWFLLGRRDTSRVGGGGPLPGAPVQFEKPTSTA